MQVTAIKRMYDELLVQHLPEGTPSWTTRSIAAHLGGKRRTCSAVHCNSHLRTGLHGTATVAATKLMDIASYPAYAKLLDDHSFIVNPDTGAVLPNLPVIQLRLRLSQLIQGSVTPGQ